MKLTSTLRFHHHRLKPSYSLFKDAIDKLKNLQTKRDTIRESISTSLKQKEIKRDSMLRYLTYTGHDANKFNEMSVIHIAGTKGKGSTGAMCETILRHCGYKTGFFSSPHLISVTERIKLNGKSIEEEYFAKVFNEIHQQLRDNQEYEGDIPGYFGFLTVMAFNIFIREKVDVAIVEVGIGGEYDSTNVVSNVPTVGITLLGYDHTNLLGKKIEEIARQKAGIMKPGCKAFTVQQEPAAMEVLKEMAKIRKCSLTVVQDIESYNWIGTTTENDRDIKNPAKRLNASLAIQLAHNWMADNKNQRKPNTSGVLENCGTINDIPAETLASVQLSFWPGRCQVFRCEYEDFYIDGAHTEESMQVCVDWFNSQARGSSRILIFHVIDRNPVPLLKLLRKCNFDTALFVPNVAYEENIISGDQKCMTTTSEQMLKCNENASIWTNLTLDYKETNTKVLPHMLSAYSYISSNHSRNGSKPQILITGSLYLVGAALELLDHSLMKSRAHFTEEYLQ